MKISLYISELLQLNNTIIIPSLGQFILRHKSANIDKSTKKYLPPTKIISFNQEINYQDDILVDFIVKKEELSTKEAQKDLDNFISEVKFKLTNKEEVKLEGLGILFVDSKNKINFKQETNQNLSSELFGLQEITLNPIIVHKQETNKLNTDLPLTNTVSKSNKLKKILFIVSPILVIILFFAYFIFFTSYLDNSINKIFSKKTDLINLSTNNSKEAISISDSLIENDAIKKKINSTLDSTTIKKTALFYQEKQQDTLSIINTHYTYYIIAGSFKLEKNAKKYVSELKQRGYSSEIISLNNNLFRISIKSFSDETEALKELYKIRAKKELKSVWLYKSS